MTEDTQMPATEPATHAVGKPAKSLRTAVRPARRVRPGPKPGRRTKDGEASVGAEDVSSPPEMGSVNDSAATGFIDESATPAEVQPKQEPFDDPASVADSTSQTSLALDEPIASGAAGDLPPPGGDAAVAASSEGASVAVAAEPRREPVFGQGVIEISGKGFGFLRDFKRNYQQNPMDIFVTPEAVRRFALRDGMMVRGEVRRGGRGPQLSRLTEINGGPPERIKDLPLFEELTCINPEVFVRLETVSDRYTTRVIDLMTPIGRGQRGLIVAPPRTGKTTLLQHMAESVMKQHPELHLMLLLVDERPEEVTEFRHVLPGAEIWASSNDSDLKSHTRIAQLAIERAKRLVEDGQHVFMLLDSITRVGRAFNNAMANSGRTMSGGVDARALEIPRRLFAAARNTEKAGSLTIIATALVETGSKMDELIFQEFKGTGNMELVLDRKIAEQRTYPAVDIFRSGTRREELLLAEADLHKISVIRRGLAGHRPIEAIERLLFFLRKFATNNQMLREIPG